MELRLTLVSEVFDEVLFAIELAAELGTHNMPFPSASKGLIRVHSLDHLKVLVLTVILLIT